MILKQMKFYATDETPAQPLESVPEAPVETPQAPVFDLAKLNSVDDVAAAKEALRNEPEQTPDEDTVIPDTSEQEQIDEQQPVVKEEPAEVITEAAPEKDTAKSLILDDEILSKLSDDERRALEKYKGKDVNELIKALANTQLQIGKLANDKSKAAKEQLFNKPAEQKPVEPLSKEYRDNTILGRVKDLLPDGIPQPPNADPKSPEFKEWYKDLVYEYPIDLPDFVQALKTEAVQVDNLLNKYNEVKTNHSTIIVNQQDEAIKQINTYFKDRLKVDIKDLGYDLTPDANGDVSLLNELMFEDGKPDPEIIQYAFNDPTLPVINTKALATKFLQNYVPEVVNKKLEAERRAVYQKKDQQIKEIKAPPTLQGAPQKKGITVTDIAKADTPEAIQALKEQLKNS